MGDGTSGSHGKNGSNEERLLPARGDYQTLLSFQKAEVIYDLTFRFAHKFLSKGDCTIDQMVQSARSGRPARAHDPRAFGAPRPAMIPIAPILPIIPSFGYNPNARRIFSRNPAIFTCGSPPPNASNGT
jgi:hypothetical protein